jgi:hypothetical protein
LGKFRIAEEEKQKYAQKVLALVEFSESTTTKAGFQRGKRGIDFRRSNGLSFDVWKKERPSGRTDRMWRFIRP